MEQHHRGAQPQADHAVNGVEGLLECLPAQVPGLRNPGEQRGVLEAGYHEQAEVGGQAGADVAGERHHQHQGIQRQVRVVRQAVLQRRAGDRWQARPAQP